MSNQKPVRLFDEKMNLIKKFKTTEECARFFNKSKAYINYNLAHCSKIRKDDKWYIIIR